VERHDLRGTATDGLLQGVDDAGVQGPEDVVVVEEDVDDGLEGLAVALLLGSEARERDEERVAEELVAEGDLG